MISRLGLALCAAFRRTAPDPFVIAIGLTLVTALLALIFGDITSAESVADLPPWLRRPASLLEAWRADNGLWRFLAFGMQMCLILVTGHALACTRPIRAMIDALAGIPRGTASAALIVSFVACVFGLINWGLGLIVGALLAREVGRSLEQRGLAAHYPLICASGYLGMLIWHGGLSGSAPLSMTTVAGAAKVLPDEALATLGDAGIPLSQTILSPMNLFVSGGLLLGAPLVMAMLAPKQDHAIQPYSQFDVASDGPSGQSTAHCESLPDKLDQSPLVAWLLAIPLLLALVQYVSTVGLGSIGLNEINAGMLGLGLILQGSPKAYMDAVADGARGCAGIIIQFPLYAGIMAMMATAGLVGMLASGMAGVGNEMTIPIMSFLSAGVVNLFVPSGGGQWGIQGPIALETGLAAGIAPGKMIMAVAYGDQLTNMLQPFWALPLLAITGVRARDIVGYTAIIMVVSMIWVTIGLLVF